ncbi:MAG: hypothetical protein WC792_04740 [Candidatus Micrarchaeia archaeon]|jgi:hypothetical protein
MVRQLAKVVSERLARLEIGSHKPTFGNQSDYQFSRLQLKNSVPVERWAEIKAELSEALSSKGYEEGKPHFVEEKRKFEPFIVGRMEPIIPRGHFSGDWSGFELHPELANVKEAHGKGDRVTAIHVVFRRAPPKHFLSE